MCALDAALLFVIDRGDDRKERHLGWNGKHSNAPVRCGADDLFRHVVEGAADAEADRHRASVHQVLDVGRQVRFPVLECGANC